MKKILIILMIFSPFLLFSDLIEIVPKPVNNIVGTNKIVVRGVGDYGNSEIRIAVSQNGNIRYYSPIILSTELDGYYVHGVELFNGLNTIKLEKKTSSGWTGNEMPTMAVTYSPTITVGTDAAKSLWGRIANQDHQKEEQRAAYFYQGPRFGSQTENTLLLYEPEINHDLFLKGMLNIDINHVRSVTLSGDNLRKDLVDTKGPADLNQKCWSSKERINEMMDEVKDANVNILMWVYWGDNDETLEDNLPENAEGIIDEQYYTLPDNFVKVSSAATLMETCDYRLAFENNFCVIYSNEDRLTPTPANVAGTKSRHLVRRAIECECAGMTDEGVLDGKCNYTEQVCYYGTCRKKGCSSDFDCNSSEESCAYSRALGINICVPVDNTGIPLHYHYYIKENCNSIYSPSEYEASGTDAQGREYDATDQLFKAAADRDILVVPSIEPSVYYAAEFPHNIEPLKNTLRRLLRKYGGNPNWLQIYDKEGNERKAIHIAQAIGIAPGQYFDNNDNGNLITITSGQYQSAMDAVISDLESEFPEYKLGFLLDNTVMPADFSALVNNFFVPSANDIKEMNSLLGVSIFGFPFNQYIYVSSGREMTWIWAVDAVWDFLGTTYSAFEGDNYPETIDNHGVRKAREWLENWVSSTDYIPMVANVVPGYDDRWRGIPHPLFGGGYNVFGDNESWRQRNADLVFMYNTAGISLSIWNGYGEGYVWVPYKKRSFAFDTSVSPYYTIDPDYQTGSYEIREDLSHFKFVVDSNSNPVYEDEVIYDNYRYAMYLFSADRDGDGIFNYFDNCPDIPNPMVMNNSEIVTAPCINGIGGAACMEHAWRFTYKDENGNYHWQPDHDLDGVGDACDPDTIWVDFPGIPVGKPLTKPGLNGAVRTENTESNNTLLVTLDMKSTASEQSEETATTRYCWLTKTDFNDNLWGTEGYCTTEAGHTDGECERDFGYSHGTDPKPAISEGVPSWKFIKNRSNAEISDEFTTIPTKTTREINWNWRYDFKKDKPLELGSTLDYPVLCTTPSIFGLCEDETVPRFYYTMSTGVHSGTGTYLINDQINPAFFKNTQKFARSSRLTLDPVPVSYHYTMKITGTETQKYCLGVPCNFPGEWWHDILLDQLIHGPRPYENPGMEHFFKNAYGSDMTRTGMSFREWSVNASGNPSATEKSRPEFLLTMSKNISGTNTGILAVQNTLMQTMSYNSQTSAGLTFKIAEMDLSSNGNWRVQGVLNNIPENFMPVASTSHKSGLYVVSRENFSSAIINNLYIITQTVPGGNTCTETLNIFVPELIGSLPDISNITIHSFSDGLVAVGEGANGMEVHKLIEQSGDAWFENITGTVMPSTRDVYTVEIKDGVLYLAGGAEVNDNAVDLKTDIWKFTESDGWTLIRNDLNLFPASFRIDFGGTDIVLTNRIVKFDATTERVRFNSDGSGDTPVVEIVPVDGVPAESYGGYCLNETGTLIKGGLEISGECVPFTHPWYRSFATGSTIYSVAGKGDRLYVGTNNSIKVYDISDPNALVLKSTFSTGGRIVYDLEVVEGDIMYAATSGGIYKLNTANPDTLASLSFFATSYNYQYRIQLYNDKLYVGDDNGINIRDKETFTRLAYVNIDSVLDFAIANGEIALYRSSFWSAGLHIRDVETLNLKAYEYAECYTGELTTDHGAFYLSCDGYEYRFEGRPDTYFNFYPLDGDMREMQENHVYNGWTYIPDGSNVKLSTNNDVPNLCGNSIIEPGELCDGNSVACTSIDPDYYGGTAYCNSTCDGYDESSCETDDGW